MTQVGAATIYEELRRKMFADLDQPIDYTDLAMQITEAPARPNERSAGGDAASGFISGAGATLEAGARLPSMTGSAVRGIGQSLQSYPARQNLQGEIDPSDRFFKRVREVVGGALESVGRTAEKEFE